jgi:hypothetical protein
LIILLGILLFVALGLILVVINEIADSEGKQ